MEIVEDAAGITLRETIPRVIPVVSPAAGADFSIPVTSGALWIVESIVATFVTSAVVANRLPVITLTDGSTLFARIPAIAVQAATTTVRYSFLRGYGDKSNAAPSAAVVQGFPSIPLLGGFQITAVTQNIDVTDQWSAIAIYVVEVEERPYAEELGMDVATLRGKQSLAFPQIPLGS